MSVKSALEKYSRKHSGIIKKRQVKSKNERPEKAVEKEVIQWCKIKGFSVSVVEAKAVYSQSAGMYLRGPVEAGFADIVGCTNNGTACFIELKAIGKRSTLSKLQYNFLMSKINLGSFAVCVDSASYLNTVFDIWSSIVNVDARKQYLIDLLPDKSDKDDEPIF
jgi:hypothetical protein